MGAEESILDLLKTPKSNHESVPQCLHEAELGPRCVSVSGIPSVFKLLPFTLGLMFEWLASRTSAHVGYTQYRNPSLRATALYQDKLAADQHIFLSSTKFFWQWLQW
jgi:hypothetical protein